MISLICGIKEKEEKTPLIDTENRLVVTRGGGWEVGKMGVGSQKVQAFSYIINKAWGCNVQAWQP